MSGASGLEHLKPFLPGLESALEDSEVSEIMINGPGNVWVERAGRLAAHAAPDLDEAALERAAIHIARPLGLDPATSPIVDARLDDGSRVAICVPPASPQVAITVRRFGKRAFSADDLVKQGALPRNVRDEAERMLRSRRNILVSGGTGSGKTTLLNALIELLPDDERIVAIEDTLELRIERSNCVRFEARGLQEGAVTIRDLVRHALRHRPEEAVFVKGYEARTNQWDILRYVLLDGDNFNARLIREGYAHAYRRFPFSKRAEFIQLEAQARRRGIGLWNRR